MLIVEDEQISRRALTSLLASHGYKTTSYESAEDALEHLVEHPSPSAVMLVDVDLPGMSGLQLIEKLRRMDPAFRAVLITAVEGERITLFRRDHVVGYLRKPIDVRLLLDLLDASHGRSGLTH